MGKLLPAQLHITYNGQEIDYTKAAVEYAFTPNNDFSQNSLTAIQQWQSLTSNKLPISNIPNSVWLKISVNSLPHYGPFNYININNPHINYLQCYIVKNDSIIQNFGRSGDNMPHASRPLPTASFVYKADGENLKDCYFIIAADKRYTKLDLPIDFCSESYYLNQNHSQNLLTGLLLGIGIFIFIFNLLLFISIRQNLYLWYLLYALNIVLYLGIDMGLMFKYAYPNLPELNDIIRPVSFALCFIPLLSFFNAILDIKNNLPRLYQFNKIFAICFLILLTIAVATSSAGNYKIQGMWVYVNRIISPLLLLTIFFEAFYCLTKKMRFAIFPVISFTGFTIFVTIYALQQGLVIAHTNFTSIAHYWGLIFEAMVMAFAMAWRFKFYKEDLERLLIENQLQQEKIFKEIALYQEKEMGRISSLLHDNLGANLGLLRLEADNMPLTEEARNTIATHITRIGNEVRTMSHSFSPVMLKDKGLQAAIADNVKFIVANSSIDLQFEWIGESNKISFQYEVIIYRIVQEILQNLLKHSKASFAFLQIIATDNLISIYGEDDGLGYDESAANNGVGLKSIKKLVSLLKGSFNIESEENNGFNISIEFNLGHHEKI
jgi:signal transduction histidine kinase